MPNWAIYAGMACIGIILAAFLVRAGLRWIRHRIWMGRYNDAPLVTAMMAGQIAQGMTLEMVLDVWGDPADMDETVMKTKTKRELKYDQTGKNRFGTRVYLENGLVVGWETK